MLKMLEHSLGTYCSCSQLRFGRHSSPPAYYIGKRFLGISTIHGLLLDTSAKLPYIKHWDADLDNDKMESWHSCFQRGYKGFLNVSLLEANVKVLTR